MQFGLKINPGREVQTFLESRVSSLRSSEFEKGLQRLNEDVPLIFSGRYDKLKKDSRFRQYFLTPKENLRLDQGTLGETFVGAFNILDCLFSDKIAGATDKQARQQFCEEYFKTKLDALENLFAGDISVLDHYFIQMFLRCTYHDHRLEGEELEQVQERFKKFLAEEDTLLNFFFYLDEFNNLNIERGRLDQEKKASFTTRLEEEINLGLPTKNLKRQMVICKMLRSVAEKLIAISAEHNPLDQVRRVLDEVYAADGQENVIRGILEKFGQYYEFEMEILKEGLVYKRIIFMNAGSKAASQKRKAWIAEMDFKIVDRLVNLLEVPETPGARLTRDQEEQTKLFQKYRKKINDYRQTVKEEDKRENCLDEGEMNLLVLRLSNVSQLEEQVSRVEARLAEFRRQNSVDYQNTMIQSYNENIRRLTQSLYFYIELSVFKRAPIQERAKATLEKIKADVRAIEEEITGVQAEPETAGETEGKPGEVKPEDKAEQKPEEKPEEKKPEKKPDPASEKDPEKRAQLMAEALTEMPDSAKIKPLKELAYTGNLDTLRYIMPLSQYSSDFLRNLARNSVIKIILRLLRENEENPVLGIQQKKKLLDFVVGMESKYAYLKEMELTSSAATQKILDILIREDKDFTAKTLSEIIIDEDDQVRATAVKIIADMMKQNESNLLMKMLNDRDARVRANVIESIEAIGNRNVLGILMKFKFDKDNRVRGNTLKAIWKFGHKDIIEPLEEMLVSEEPKMRATACWVIGEIGHGQPELQSLLKVVNNDTDQMVRDNQEKAQRKINRREQGLSVLVVDDDLKFCQEICRQLNKDGLRATAAFSGKLALSSTEKSAPDIILLDLRMPEMNGLEVLKALRSQPGTAEVPVVVLSDLNSSILLKQVVKSGANDYLLKPCSYEQVKTKLQSYL
ncbi:MAG: response regulator [Candidatus Glassbacteria bacterium]